MWSPSKSSSVVTESKEIANLRQRLCLPPASGNPVASAVSWLGHVISADDPKEELGCEANRLWAEQLAKSYKITFAAVKDTLLNHFKGRKFRVETIKDSEVPVLDSKLTVLANLARLPDFAVRYASAKHWPRHLSTAPQDRLDAILVDALEAKEGVIQTILSALERDLPELPIRAIFDQIWMQEFHDARLADCPLARCVRDFQFHQLRRILTNNMVHKEASWSRSGWCQSITVTRITVVKLSAERMLPKATLVIHRQALETLVRRFMQQCGMGVFGKVTCNQYLGNRFFLRDLLNEYPVLHCVKRLAIERMIRRSLNGGQSLPENFTLQTLTDAEANEVLDRMHAEEKFIHGELDSYMEAIQLAGPNSWIYPLLQQNLELIFSFWQTRDRGLFQSLLQNGRALIREIGKDQWGRAAMAAQLSISRNGELLGRTGAIQAALNWLLDEPLSEVDCYSQVQWFKRQGFCFMSIHRILEEEKANSRRSGMHMCCQRELGKYLAGIERRLVRDEERLVRTLIQTLENRVPEPSEAIWQLLFPWIDGAFQSAVQKVRFHRAQGVPNWKSDYWLYEYDRFLDALAYMAQRMERAILSSFTMTDEGLLLASTELQPLAERLVEEFGIGENVLADADARFLRKLRLPFNPALNVSGQVDVITARIRPLLTKDSIENMLRQRPMCLQRRLSMCSHGILSSDFLQVLFEALERNLLGIRLESTTRSEASHEDQRPSTRTIAEAMHRIAFLSGATRHRPIELETLREWYRIVDGITRWIQHEVYRYAVYGEIPLLEANLLTASKLAVCNNAGLRGVHYLRILNKKISADLEQRFRKLVKLARVQAVTTAGLGSWQGPSMEHLAQEWNHYLMEDQFQNACQMRNRSSIQMLWGSVERASQRRIVFLSKDSEERIGSILAKKLAQDGKQPLNLSATDIRSMGATLPRMMVEVVRERLVAAGFSAVEIEQLLQPILWMLFDVEAQDHAFVRGLVNVPSTDSIQIKEIGVDFRAHHVVLIFTFDVASLANPSKIRRVKLSIKLQADDGIIGPKILAMNTQVASSEDFKTMDFLDAIHRWFSPEVVSRLIDEGWIPKSWYLLDTEARVLSDEQQAEILRRAVTLM